MVSGKATVDTINAVIQIAREAEEHPHTQVEFLEQTKNFLV